MASDNERLEELKFYTPGGEDRKVAARFYRNDKSQPPRDVVIDGVVYQRVEHQEEQLLFLKTEDMRRKLLDKLDPQTYDLVYQLTCAEEGISDLRRRRLIEQIKSFLPQHEEMIDFCDCPEDFPMNGVEQRRHTYCTLAPVPVAGGE